ncbi:hypothetical protein D9613_012711 [Agrocybe pediades]|uniref:Uncharacterized protein n=1 Tax=Agrocybe pediades TaxID=84607 RepID=A0A8H4QKD7_9AGAR|nr:hypothetical protein D9613_012711 [Agrocybe pediades]
MGSKVMTIIGIPVVLPREEEPCPWKEWWAAYTENWNPVMKSLCVLVQGIRGILSTPWSTTSDTFRAYLLEFARGGYQNEDVRMFTLSLLLALYNRVRL